MFSTSDIIDMAIRLEKNGEKVYRGAIEKISNAELVSLLKWMAEEEVKHAKWFAQLRQTDESWDENGLAQELSSQFLDSLLREQSFSLKDTDFSKIGKIEELIATFTEFEKDTILFYEMLEPFIENKKTLDKLKEIIAEEYKHVDQLEAFLTDSSDSKI